MPKFSLEEDPHIGRSLIVTFTRRYGKLFSPTLVVGVGANHLEQIQEVMRVQGTNHGE